VAQRTFVAAYTNIAQYQPGTKFPSWLFTIARYQLQTEITRLRRLADYHSKFAPDLVQQLFLHPQEDSLNLWEQRLEHLRSCLNQLGAGLRQYITWRYEDQISIDQMAQASGRSAAAVKKQLWLLRQKLHRCVEQRMSIE
jgi:RNA polymerase sigma-70 factor (ECF subfamily)